eukprot:2686122-Ditylum_brightwellii.AAC.1
MVQTELKVVESADEFGICIKRCKLIAIGRIHDILFFWWEIGLAKACFKISSFREQWWWIARAHVRQHSRCDIMEA